jgi:hypothetical protein
MEQAQRAAADPTPEDVSGQKWPVHITRPRGTNPLPILGGLAIGAVVVILPGVMSGQSVGYMLLHVNGFLLAMLAAMTIFFLATWLASRRSGELDVDATGVTVRTGPRSWFYDWADVEQIDQVKGAVRISLRGRSKEENAYNLVSARFVGSESKLRALISDGLARFGPDRPRPGKSQAPGDDLRRATLRSVGSLLGVFGLIFGGLFVIMTGWATTDALKTLDLQKYGSRTEASVVRIYTSACGRGSCSRNVEYVFTPRQDGKSYRGDNYIASSRSKTDPDLLYAETRRTVPIAYDVRNPSVSSLNFGDRVFLRKPFQNLSTFASVMFGIMLLVFTILILCMIPSLIKALTFKSKSY